jgi:dinuclear metal center YbgI/SA1388 family protein
VKRDALVKWLDNYLAVHDFQDKSLNGLQVEGADEVQKVAFAVDSSLSTFEQAAQTGADMLVVHHGLFWGQPLAMTGMHKNRVKFLLENNISLYAAHLPLDAHEEVGNNYGLARILGMTDLQGFATYKGKAVGVKGVFPNPVTLRDLANTLEQELGESVLVHAGGKLEISTMAIVSGDASWNVVTAADEGLDAFLTGEPRQETFYESFERNINALYAGHYMTETVGVKLLEEKVKLEFNLATQFILLPTGL